MNEFTKQELEEIREIARLCSKKGVETKHNLTYQVQAKAEYMIDNYCEHEWIETYREREVSLCTKCNKEHYENQ